MNPEATPDAHPNPGFIFDQLGAYQRTAALKAAIELKVFTEIARGNHSVAAIAQTTKSSPRGIRILCDYLVICGILRKNGLDYSLGPDAATFLDSNSPAYLGSIVNFLLHPNLIAPFFSLTDVVKNGKTTLPGEGTVSPNNPIWVDFAKEMAPMVFQTALEVADLVAGQQEVEVLDIAAGHGLFGIMVAQHNPKAHITALDWPDVLTVATSNAQRFGVEKRHSLLPGDAFETDLAGPYDLVLVTNFFHHFDPATCEKLMRKIHASLKPAGRCVTLDFVPNEDRISPPTAAGFAMMMLGTTAAGDAYTFNEYDTMFRNAGFTTSELHNLTRAPQSVIITWA